MHKRNEMLDSTLGIIKENEMSLNKKRLHEERNDNSEVRHALY